MADRDELTLADMANQIPDPGMGPPQGPLRLTVRPAGFAAPPNDLAQGQPWGAPDAETGRPGRLFEPDQTPAPPQRALPWLPRTEQQLGGLGRGLGALVEGAKDWWNAPAQATTGDNTRQHATAPPLATLGPQRGSFAPVNPMAGVRPDRYDVPKDPPLGLRAAGGVVDMAGEALQVPHNMIEAGRVINSPAATPQQVQQARAQEGQGVAETGMNLWGFNAPFSALRKGATAGVFGGRMSEGADMSKLQLAKRMEDNAVTPPSIWKQTGWMRGADNQWRYEIPDLPSRYTGGDFRTQLKVQQGQQLYLPDVIHHPELFAAYPELRRLPVSKDMTLWASGAYTPASKNLPASIAFREEEKAARGQTLKVLLHEIQHAIQQIEGFARGGNPNRVPQPGEPGYKILEGLMRGGPDEPMGRAEYMNWAAKRGAKPTETEYETYRLNALNDRAMHAQQAREVAGQENYWRLAGEKEGDVVMERPDLTAPQRAAVYPGSQMKVPMNRQIVEFNLPHGGGTIAKEGQLGSVLNPMPREMQASSRPAPSGQPKFPQYGERYPEVGPGVPTIDPKTKKEYLAKQLTPEAEAFAKELERVNKTMAKEGYTPYFDPAKREHVDPKHYPPNVDTTKIVPKKQATIDKDLETIASEDARSKLRNAYQRGTEMPNTKDWYAMKQLEDEFIKELGPEAGRKAFQDKIATSMAATTGGADPLSNWRMAHYGNYLREKGLPYPAAAHEMPYPIGGRYASGNMAMHQKIFDEGGFPALGAANPKRHNFSQNFTGNRGAATMDEQMTSLMTPGINMPPPGKYGLYENVLGEEAAKVGVQPQNYQDVAWSGAKNLKDPRYTSGQPFIQTINESIERTHRLTGMPREEIVKRGIIRSEIPVYGLTGAVALGSLVDPSGYNR